MAPTRTSQLQIGHRVRQRDLGLGSTGLPRAELGTKLLPAALAVDEDAAALERVRHERRGPLGILQAHQLHTASDAPLEPAGELSAALAHLPAVWLVTGLAVALVGLAPRVAVPTAWEPKSTASRTFGSVRSASRSPRNRGQCARR